MNSKTISPHRSSKDIGEKDSGSVVMGDNAMERIEMEENENMTG